MNAVGIEIRRYVDDSQPGFVECWLTDANGREWSFIEKVPVVTTEDIDAESQYPQQGIIACEVIERRIGADGREVLVIDTVLPWGVESTTGETRFVVLLNQVQQWD
jgi:hypothetical protein